MIGIRGAITVGNDKKEEILEAAKTLLCSIMEKNNIINDDIVSIVFTCTQDISSAYPAEAARDMGIVNAGLLCLNEMVVKGSLEKCLRVLILANKNIPQKLVNHVYLGGAVVLRPDLVYK